VICHRQQDVHVDPADGGHAHGVGDRMSGCPPEAPEAFYMAVLTPGAVESHMMIVAEGALVRVGGAGAAGRALVPVGGPSIEVAVSGNCSLPRRRPGRTDPVWRCSRRCFGVSDPST
jgi:hypothetical protein